MLTQLWLIIAKAPCGSMRPGNAPWCFGGGQCSYFTVGLDITSAQYCFLSDGLMIIGSVRCDDAGLSPVHSRHVSLVRLAEHGVFDDLSLSLSVSRGRQTLKHSFSRIPLSSGRAQI